MAAGIPSDPREGADDLEVEDGVRGNCTSRSIQSSEGFRSCGGQGWWSDVPRGSTLGGAPCAFRSTSERVFLCAPRTWAGLACLEREKTETHVG